MSNKKEESLEEKIAKLNKAAEANLKKRDEKKDVDTNDVKITKPIDPMEFYSNPGTYLYSDRSKVDIGPKKCHRCGVVSMYLNKCDDCGFYYCGECLSKINHECQFL